MKQAKPQKPFHPVVSLEEIFAFDPTRPETFTASPLINALCQAYAETNSHSGKEVADYMNLDLRKLSSAVEILTGCSLGTLKEKYHAHLVAKIRSEHPEWSTDHVAQAAGLYNRSAFRNLVRHNNIDVEYKKQRKQT